MPVNTNPTNRTNTIKIMFSHIPLTTKWTKFTDRVIIIFIIVILYFAILMYLNKKIGFRF